MARLLFVALLTVSCTTAPNPPPDEVNVFVQNVERVGEYVGAVEDILICDSDLLREWLFRPVGTALSTVVPFFAGADSICED